MPKGIYDRHGITFRRATYSGPRPWENTDPTPFSDVRDCSRGEIRLAAEVALAEFKGDALPGRVVVRAIDVLKVMARA